MPDKIIQQNFSELFVKTLFPAFLIIAIGVAIDMKSDRKNISWINAGLSFVIGISGAYLSSGLIGELFKGGTYTFVLCTFTLLTEKIVKFVMNEFNVDIFLTAVVDYLYQKLKKILK